MPAAAPRERSLRTTRRRNEEPSEPSVGFEEAVERRHYARRAKNRRGRTRGRRDVRRELRRRRRSRGVVHRGGRRLREKRGGERQRRRASRARRADGRIPSLEGYSFRIFATRRAPRRREGTAGRAARTVPSGVVGPPSMPCAARVERMRRVSSAVEGGRRRREVRWTRAGRRSTHRRPPRR